jgi:hypothetical protein
MILRRRPTKDGDYNVSQEPTHVAPLAMHQQSHNKHDHATYAHGVARDSVTLTFLFDNFA